MEKTTYYWQECESAQYVCIGKNELIQYKRKCSEWIETTYASQTESLGKQRFGALFLCSRSHTSLHLKSEAKVSDFFYEYFRTCITDYLAQFINPTYRYSDN